MNCFVYIDGFNVYHSLDDHITFTKKTRANKKNIDNIEKLKWLNFRALLNLMEPKLKIQNIYFFTATPNHLNYSKKIERHKNYINLLINYQKIEVISGYFDKKSKQEKKTDVSLAVKFIVDYFTARPDYMIIISNDSDFSPAIDYVASNSKTKIKIFTPLGTQYFSRELKSLCDKYKNVRRSEIKMKDMCSSLMEDTITIGNKIFKNPYPLP